eukprot:Gb_41501 [translate_table: standard]
MGMEIPSIKASSQADRVLPLQEQNGSVMTKPCIFIVGSPNVGKRSILTRLLFSELADTTVSASEIACHDWTIDTKYYTADVCVWVARLGDKTTNSAWTLSDHCDALVMVFDMSNSSSFEALQEWASEVDLQKFEILLCIGNKADRVPGHFAHAEYRRQLQKRGESSADPHPEFWDYGIHQDEGYGLLSEEDNPLEEMRRSCIEWCIQSNIEYIEACAINEAFDKCMSIDGDSQGVERIRSALSAHMWPGMTMKSQSKISDAPLQARKEGFSDDESDYEIEYELLSSGSADPWEGVEDHWVDVSSSTLVEIPITDTSDCENDTENEQSHIEIHKQQEADSSRQPDDLASQNDVEAASSLTSHVTGQQSEARETLHDGENDESEEKSQRAFEELELLMHEMACMRENLRLMPDSQRREMAGKLAMQMASLFADEENDDGSD